MLFLILAVLSFLVSINVVENYVYSAIIRENLMVIFLILLVVYAYCWYECVAFFEKKIIDCYDFTECKYEEISYAPVWILTNWLIVAISTGTFLLVFLIDI